MIPIWVAEIEFAHMPGLIGWRIERLDAVAGYPLVDFIDIRDLEIKPMPVRVGFSRIEMDCRLTKFHRTVRWWVAIVKAQPKSEFLLIPFGGFPNINDSKRWKEADAINVWSLGHDPLLELRLGVAQSSRFVT
jgi:hypothetical protein